MLRRSLSLFSTSVVLAALVALFSCSPALHAQQSAQDNHIVTPTQLQQQVQDSAAVRQKNIDTLNEFLTTSVAQQAMKTAKVDPVQIKTAIPTLSDAELANLSARTQHAQQEFAAGHLSNGAWLIIAIAVIVVIIVIAVH